MAWIKLAIVALLAFLIAIWSGFAAFWLALGFGSLAPAAWASLSGVTQREAKANFAVAIGASIAALVFTNITVWHAMR